MKNRKEIVEACLKAIAAHNYFIQEGCSQEDIARAQIEGTLVILEILGLIPPAREP